MLGRMKRGVKKVMEITIELVKEVCESVKISERTKCTLMISVGIALCVTGISRYGQAVEIDALKHLNKVKELKGGL